MPTLENYLQEIRTLSPAPRILTELLPLLAASDVDSGRIVELITFDPALTVNVLRRCNSAEAGLAEPVHNLSEAVTRLGFNEIYRIVAAVVGQSTLGAAQPGYGMLTGELWRHSAAAAVAARTIARTLDGDENSVFTAALLHDIGKLLLSSSLKESYPAVAREIVQAEQPFAEAEKTILGVEHAELGGRVLAQWNFPENLVSAVWHHHDPIQARPHEQAAAYVYMGDVIAHFLGYGHGHHSYAARGRAEALEILEITPKEIESFVVKTDTALKASTWFFTTQP